MLKQIRTFFILFFILLGITACSQATPQESAMQTVDEMIKAIESGNRALIVEKYAYIGPNKKVDIRDFSESKAKKLLKLLKEAEGVKPTMSQDNKTATFKVPSSHRDLIFSDIDGQWKLNN